MDVQETYTRPLSVKFGGNANPRKPPSPFAWTGTPETCARSKATVKGPVKVDANERRRPSRAAANQRLGSPGICAIIIGFAIGGNATSSSSTATGAGGRGGALQVRFCGRASSPYWLRTGPCGNKGSASKSVEPASMADASGPAASAL